MNLIDKVVLYTEGMMGDTTTEIPVGHFQKLVEAVANKVTLREFTTICYNIGRASRSADTQLEPESVSTLEQSFDELPQMR
jgi:hypothetical protein